MYMLDFKGIFMWQYKGAELQDSDIPTEAIGFIYLIRQTSTGRKYIGRKLLTRASTKTVKGKRKKLRIESDWRNYWSSSPKIKEWIEEQGTHDFTREILTFVSSKSELMYAEEYALYNVNALLKDEWVNENIRSKIMKSWFNKNKADFLLKIEELKQIIT